MLQLHHMLVLQIKPMTLLQIQAYYVFELYFGTSKLVHWKIIVIIAT